MKATLTEFQIRLLTKFGLNFIYNLYYLLHVFHNFYKTIILIPVRCMLFSHTFTSKINMLSNCFFQNSIIQHKLLSTIQFMHFWFTIIYIIVQKQHFNFRFSHARQYPCPIHRIISNYIVQQDLGEKPKQ